MRAVGGCNGDLPGTILTLGAGLTGFLAQPVRPGVGEGAFGLGESDGLGTRIEPVALGNDSDRTGVGRKTVHFGNFACKEFTDYAVQYEL